ncbi:aspartate/glutamate racemase family protein [Deinococcus sp. HMF7604]|uniref:aspartate/glutamate racemase family protein n=1 Tax=Deinococcus betulae TaxID=2873312 RepID=UPI001CCA45C0|nr:aspartate/glutamate racemase family protein [Deinococcus betulae]
MSAERLLGVLGGMSWTSTAEYYRQINAAYAGRRGGLHSAPLLIHSFDFARVVALQQAAAWDEAAELLGNAAQGLQAAGAGALLIATNTMHLVAPQLEARLEIPLLHIVDSTGAALKAAGIERVGLLATAFTMEQPFYKDRLREKFGIETLVPEAPQRAEVHRVIFDELCRNDIRADSRERYRAVMADLAAQGAQGIILGCTEIPLLVGPEDSPVPTFDITALHAQAAVEWLLGGAS